MNNAKNTASSQQQGGHQDSPHAYYALGVFLLAYILSFIDRNVMAVLIGPIREDFAISDFQYSLLHGFAFSMFYIVLGLPIGRLADRYSRRWIVTIGVFGWSIMTCLCGLAGKFKWLFLARMGVGVGEAALSPPVYSLLSDFFSAEKLPRALAVYTLGITLGSGLAFILGGAIYQYFDALDTLVLPLVGEVRPWQMTFIVVGAPGFIVTLMLLAVKEPKRLGLVAKQESTEQDGSVQSSTDNSGAVLPLTEVLAYTKKHWQVYTSIFLGVSLLAVVGYGTLAWYTEYLIRNHGMSRADAGGMYGLVMIFAGSLGTLVGGWSIKRLSDMGYRDANMRMIMLAAVCILIPAVAGPLMPTGFLALVVAVPLAFFLNCYFGVCIAGIQLITPNQMRALLSAAFLFMTNLFGLALGPSFVAGITDFVFQDDLALRYSLAIIPAVFCPISALLIAWGLKYYRRALETAEEWQ